MHAQPPWPGHGGDRSEPLVAEEETHNPMVDSAHAPEGRLSGTGSAFTDDGRSAHRRRQRREQRRAPNAFIPHSGLPGFDLLGLFGPTAARVFKGIAVVLSGCVVANIIFACLYSYISANSSNYVLGEDWQACTVYADMAIKAYDKSYALYAPIMISALSEQNMVFAILSLVVVYRALYRTEWLLSTVWWLMYVVTGLVCFLGIGPVIPFPTQMHANVLTLTAYVHPDMYATLGQQSQGLPDGLAGVCGMVNVTNSAARSHTPRRDDDDAAAAASAAASGDDDRHPIERLHNSSFGPNTPAAADDDGGANDDATNDDFEWPWGNRDDDGWPPHPFDHDDDHINHFFGNHNGTDVAFNAKKVCKPAYRLNAAFVAVQWTIIVLVTLLLVLAGMAELGRRHVEWLAEEDAKWEAEELARERRRAARRAARQARAEAADGGRGDPAEGLASLREAAGDTSSVGSGHSRDKGYPYLVGTLGDSARSSVHSADPEFRTEPSLLADAAAAAAFAELSADDPLAAIPLPTRGQRWPRIWVYCTFVSYMVFTLSRGSASIVSLGSFENILHSYFPFAMPVLDIPTIFVLMSSISIMRGTVSMNVGAFRVSAAVSFLFCLLSYAQIVQNAQLIHETGISRDRATCVNWFAETQAGMFGFPSKHAARILCTATWVSLSAFLCLVVSMHGMCVACVCVMRDHVAYDKAVLAATGADTDSDGGYSTGRDSDLSLPPPPPPVARGRRGSRGPQSSPAVGWTHEYDVEAPPASPHRAGAGLRRASSHEALTAVRIRRHTDPPRQQAGVDSSAV